MEDRLVTTLRRTKTSGASRRVKELPVCISERAYLARSGWLAMGSTWLRSTRAISGTGEEDGRLC